MVAHGCCPCEVPPRPQANVGIQSPLSGSQLRPAEAGAPGSRQHHCEDGGNFSNATSRSTETVTLSSNAPDSFHVVATTLCGPENENSPDNVGLPSIMSLKLANRFCLRP